MKILILLALIQYQHEKKKIVNLPYRGNQRPMEAVALKGSGERSRGLRMLTHVWVIEAFENKTVMNEKKAYDVKWSTLILALKASIYITRLV